MSHFTIIRVLYPFTVLIVFLVSLTSFSRGWPKHLRIFSALLGCTLLVELNSLFRIVTSAWSTFVLYNAFIFIEFMCYAAYYLCVLRLRRVRALIKGFFIGYPIIWGASIAATGIYRFNSYPFLVGSLFTVILSIAYYYQLITASDDIRLRTHPEFWIATGLILFYASYLPAYSTSEVLFKISTEVLNDLFLMAQSVSLIMYATFLMAFLCKLTTPRSSS